MDSVGADELLELYRSKGGGSKAREAVLAHHEVIKTLLGRIMEEVGHMRSPQLRGSRSTLLSSFARRMCSASSGRQPWVSTISRTFRLCSWTASRRCVLAAARLISGDLG